MELTDRKARILEFVRQFDLRNGYPPSVREIAAAVGLKSTKSVKDHLDWLVAHGFMRRSDRAARAISITSRVDQGDRLPVVGQVAAGTPVLAQQNITGWVEMPGYGSDRHFFLRVRGDSMQGDAILDGDLVLVRTQPFVEQGEVSVVLVGDDATVKRFYRRGPDEVELAPSNPAYAVQRYGPGSESVRVVGRVVAVLRLLEDFGEAGPT